MDGKPLATVSAYNVLATASPHTAEAALGCRGLTVIDRLAASPSYRCAVGCIDAPSATRVTVTKCGGVPAAADGPAMGEWRLAALHGPSSMQVGLLCMQDRTPGAQQSKGNGSSRLFTRWGAWGGS
jgi:hypothetical protein